MNIYISGIGGTGTFYAAKYFLALGYKVFGSDLERNERVIELEDLGADILVGQPEKTRLENLNIHTYIYSAALPTHHLEKVYFEKQLKVENPQLQFEEIGDFTDQLLTKFLAEDLSEKEMSAVEKANLAPLTKIDWNAKKYIAVTGTDGKSTTCTMIYHILSKLGEKAALITTLGMEVDGKLVETGLHTTTPTAQELYEILSSPKLADVDFVILETTSHGLAMGRLAGAKFDVAAITNITEDHLDYHITWQNYFNSKARLIKYHLKEGIGTAILNPFDQKSYSQLEQICNKLSIKNIKISEPDISQVQLPTKMDTNYNRENGALAARAVMACMRVNSQKNQQKEKTSNDSPIFKAVAAKLQNLSGLTGRMQYMQQNPFKVIVDFAHTANSLEKVLTELTKQLDQEGEVNDQSGKIHVVFGCAGMRDSQKRAPMGRAAANLADAIYICPEDPRLEKLPEINFQILTGMGIDMTEDAIHNKLKSVLNPQFNTKQGMPVQVFQEFSVAGRQAAIAAAIAAASPNDIVVICGKGHEKSLCFGTEEQPWSDQQAVKQILAQYS